MTASSLATRSDRRKRLPHPLRNTPSAVPDVVTVNPAALGTRAAKRQSHTCMTQRLIPLTWHYAPEPSGSSSEVDESWQCTYADLGALGAMARQVVCVGDPGQIDPVVTGDVSRWDGSDTAPNLPGPIALQAAHGDAVSVVRLRHTWRLGPGTTALIGPLFYPDLPFTSRRPPEHLTDAGGVLLPELAHRSVTVSGGPSDPALVTACAQRARELLDAELVTAEDQRPMSAADIAVVVPHVTQAAAIRALLSDYPDVLVGTANALQGLERAAVVVLHPLAGYRTAEPFTLDPGRACVMLSRHRAHMSVVIDDASAEVLAYTEPSTAHATNTALLTALHRTPAV